jgi:NADH:ubiquinone oxidoreductase subunit 3 (subunit A)
VLINCFFFFCKFCWVGTNYFNTSYFNTLQSTLNFLVINSMGDIVMLFFVQNIFVFSLIFWGLTVLGSFFYKKKHHFMKKQFYECGFKSISDVNFQINLNFILLCVFLILYDIEFTLLFPLLFNFNNIYFFQYIMFLFFVLLIILSLYYDIQMNALSWQY